MKRLLIHIFFLLPIFSFAFQQDNSTRSLDLILDELELSIQLNQISSPIDTLLSFKKRCLQNDRIDLAYACYTSIGTLLVYDSGIEDKSAFLDQLIKKEAVLDLKPIQMATMAHLSAISEDYQSLESFYFQAIKALQEKKLFTSILSLQQNLAIVLLGQKNFKEALYYAGKAQDLLRDKLEYDSENQINLIEILKSIYYEMGQLDQAINLTHNNLALFEKQPEIYQEYITFSYANLSVLYNQLNDFDNALRYGLKASLAFKKDKSWTIDYIFKNNYNLAGIYLESKQYNKALRYFRENLTIDPQNISPRDQIDNLLLLTRVFIESKQVDSSRYYLQTCEELEQKFGIVDYSILLLKADVAVLSGQLKKAETYLKACIDKPVKSDLLATKAKIGLVELYIQMNRYSDCISILQSCLEDISSRFDPELMANPDIEDIIKLPLALEIFKLKMEVYSALLPQNPSMNLIRDIDNTLLLSSQCLDRLSRQLSSNNSKLYWMDTWALPAYEDALLLCHKVFEITGDQSFSTRAFELAEKGKSMLLSESIQKKIASQYSNIPDSLLLLESTLNYNIESLEQKIALKERNSKDESAELSQRLFEFKHQLNTLKLYYKSEYKKYYTLKFENDVIPISIIQNELKQNEVLIEYFEGNKNLFIFIIDNDSYRFIRKKIGLDYGFSIDKFIGLITQTTQKKDQFILDYNQYAALAYKLFEQFTDETFRETLETYQKMCIIHHGKMSYVPFDLLINSSVNKATTIREANYANLPLLLNNLAVSYHLSASMKYEALSKSNEPTRPNTSSIVAFSPQYQPDNYSECRGKTSCDLRRTLRELKGAKLECQFLKETYGAYVFEDEEATESLFRERGSKASILHLAMHGIINNKQADLSGLVFSDITNTDDTTSTSKVDNMLHSYEIRNLDLPADLVVLSACQTGNGVYQKGEGIMSMGRGFMYAGTRSILMSLWNLNDMAGYQIIKGFYNNLDKGWSKDQSLTASKRTFLQQCENSYQTHPIFWGSLSLIGDESSIVIPEKSAFQWWLSLFAVFFILPFIWILRKKR